MGKAIMKEVLITILLLIAIILVMMVIFYDYNPMNKIVPKTETYTTSEEIKNEFDSADGNFQLDTVEKTYSLDGADLNKYKYSNSYVKGKANPFAETTSQVNGTNTNNTNTNSSSGTNTQNKNPDSTGTFFNNTGTK